MDAFIRTITLILLITNLHSKGLERGIRDVGAKKDIILKNFNRVLALQMKICHSGISKFSCILFWSILE
jgi:hypothetical protein